MTMLAKRPLLPELEPFEARFRRLVAGMPLLPTTLGATPSADVYETPEEYVVELEVPGYDEKELSIEVSDHTLAISGTRKEATDEKSKRYELHERLEETFERRFPMPIEVEGAQVKAIFEKGVLKVTAPKRAITKPHAVSIEKR